MANVLQTEFIFSSANADRSIDLTEKRLINLDNRLNDFGQNPTFGKGITSQFDALNKKVNQFESNLKKLGTTDLKGLGNDLLKQAQIEKILEQTKRAKVQTLTEEVRLERQKLGFQSDQLKIERQKQSLSSRKAADPELAKANAFLEKSRQEILSRERALTKQLEAEEKTRTRVKIREAKFANDAAIREIKERARAEKAAQSSGGSNFGREALGGLGISLGIGAGVAFGVKFLKDSTEAAFEAERANRKLSASATEAGIAYGVLADKNKDFAKTAGLSETAATSVTAKIAQLATFSGKPQNIDLLQKSFLDLSAAKGISSKDIDVLIGTILSGQDEGLNRLGIADPGQLYKAYAKELGKTADQLSQFEKVQAATNAVVEKAAIFTGANAEKMASLSGQAENASANLDNLYTGFGQGLTQSLEFKNAMTALNIVLESVSTNLPKVRKGLTEGVTPRDLAIDEGNKGFNQALDALNDFSTFFIASNPLVIAYDTLTEGSKTASNRLFESISGSHKRRVDFYADSFTAEQNLLKKQSKDAEEQKTQLAGKTFVTSFQSQIDSFIKPASDGVEKTKITLQQLNKLQKDFTANFKQFNESQAELAQKGIDTAAKVFYTDSAETALKRFDRNPNIEDARTNLKALTSIKKFLPEEKFESFNDKLSDFVISETAKIQDKVKDLSKTYTDVFDNLLQKTNSNNPFVSLFSESDKAIRELRENLKGLTPELQAVALQMQQKLNADSLFNTRLENDFARFDLDERASELRSFKQPKIDDPNKFFNDFIEAGLKQIASQNGGGIRYNSNIFTNGVNPDGTPRQFTNGFSQSNENSLTRYNSNVFIDGKNPDGSPKKFTTGFTQTDLRDELTTVFERTGGFGESSGGKGFGNNIGGFFRRPKSFADLTNREKDEFINRDNLPVQQRLSRAFDLAGNRSALNEEQQATVDRKIIALSSGLRPEQLNAQQRDLVATANEKEAARKADGERLAAQRDIERNVYLSQIAENGKRLADIAEKDGFKGLENVLRVVTEGDVKAELKPAATSKDTQNAYKGGTFFDEYEQQ